jgi:SAM-dependent methyltransferase
MYPRAADLADRRGGVEHRRRLLDGLSGRVLEVGAGDGRNFAHYPPAVTEVVAVEPEPTLRALAGRAPHAVPVTVVAGVADELPAEDGSFDAAVVSLVLCSVPDQARALAELRRVLRPGGELRFYEHVVARRQPRRALFGVADLAWPKLAAGCHLSRDTGAAIAAAGFTIERCERIEFRAAPLQPRLPHILGTAYRA